MIATDNGSGSTAQRIEAELRRAIVSLELRPGMRLSEQEIALKHGVSRQPVREALIGLARTRLVDVLPQRGTVVVKISVAKMMQARFVREAIETAVVRRACTSFDQAARDRLDDLLTTQQRAAASGNYTLFHRYDELFHATLADGAGCPLAWDAISDVKAHLDRACQLTLAGPDAMTPLVAQHRAIVAAIDQADPDEAASAMRLHLTQLLRVLPRIEAENPDFFEH